MSDPTPGTGAPTQPRPKNTWPSIEEQVRGLGTKLVRSRYLADLNALTGRNTIAYYSGFLHAGPNPEIYQQTAINDLDKNSLMAAIHGMDRTLGLDLILHSPGGDLAATESLIEYLWQMFPPDSIRSIVPQMAMSGGTLIAMASSEIVMGKHSSIGPIDPQFGGISAHNVIAEFEEARSDITTQPSLAGLWGPILAHYGPTLVKQCEHAVKWADELAADLLRRGMLNGRDGEEVEETIKKVIELFGRPAINKTHSRHMSPSDAASVGLKVSVLEEDQALQDAVLPVHHAFMISIAMERAVKLVQNHLGVAIIQAV